MAEPTVDAGPDITMCETGVIYRLLLKMLPTTAVLFGPMKVVPQVVRS